MLTVDHGGRGVLNVQGGLHVLNAALWHAARAGNQREGIMAIFIIIAFVLLFMWATVVFTYKSGAIENGKYVLGITLPAQYRKEEEVLKITADYRRVMKRINLMGLAACVPVLLASDYMSFCFLFLMLWFGLLIYFHQENVERCARALYGVKQKNGWLTGNAHVVRIDTVLSSQKDKGAVSFGWMIPAYPLGLAGCFMAWQKNAGAYELSGAAIMGGGAALLPWSVTVSFIGTELLFLAVYMAVRKAKPQVICGETAFNQKMDRIVRREWTGCMVLHSYGMALFTVYMGWMAQRNGTASDDSAPRNFSALGLIVLLGIVGSAYTIYLSQHNVKKGKARILTALAESGTEVYGDDDEYWLNGYPAGMRPAGLSEKRIGIGWTTNASLKGGTADKLVLVLLAAFVVGICLFLMPFDFAQVKLEIGDGRCRVSAASMGYGFALEDVEQVTLLEKRPAMSKKSGYDSNRFFLGDFRVQGFGTCKVFVSLKNDLVIRVDTKDRIVWFNSESAEETRAFYEELIYWK